MIHRYRKPIKEDIPFILDSMLKVIKKMGDYKFTKLGLFNVKMSEELKRLLSHSQIIVLCNKEDDNHIFGYIVFRLIENVLIIHFVYMKHSYRENGFIKDLVKSILKGKDNPEIAITMVNDLALKIKAKHEMHFNPWLKEAI